MGMTERKDGRFRFDQSVRHSQLEEIAMKSLSVVLLFTAVAAIDEPTSTRWDFEDATAGKLPSGWTAAKTGEGPGSVWKVIEDSSAPRGPKVLAQTSPEGPNPLFNLCIADESGFTDLDLSVSFKAVMGETDQGGGPVWRYKDAKNYYIARMNPLEDNFRVYKVVAGKRSQLGSVEVEAAAGKWHTIRVVHKGNQIQCYLNGKLHLDVKDDTFKGAGKIGLWTKADAVTSFDELTVAAPAK
jgi:hypothetical protein